MMESPEAARVMAWPMVLQAVVGDRQLLLSLPSAPLTYHVVLATAVGATARNRAMSCSGVVITLYFMILSSSSRQFGINEPKPLSHDFFFKVIAVPSAEFRIAQAPFVAQAPCGPFQVE